jgi:hypothetical protein
MALSSCHDKRETGKNWGRLRSQLLVIGGVGEVGVPAVEVVGEVIAEDPVGFQKSVTYAEQQLHATRSHSLIKPPGTG